jgi:hypothetical protein
VELQLLVAIVDEELLETVQLKSFKAKDVKDGDEDIRSFALAEVTERGGKDSETCDRRVELMKAISQSNNSE